ncbi:sigma-70 family RNA polymerase sigma factor [Streptomyces sp. C10-9-1]|uniref:RNA polymerase sigma factor n=1 Tax=Streptomyces sp. C10-9-1 TaxID=1859285 RepID=UPI002112C61E|nr:sigma-70 family RNA polymerase sigma factor [Streptomyces sp. C10-9-1]MCQ6554987.1 sigma-70 family RNA polymerase sigma factor [Streptomyces sp. C10-9-1]
MSEHAERPFADRPDTDLAAAIRCGSGASAMAEVYARHHGAVLAYARTCCRDAHTAEDLAAEAFARTLEAVRAGRGPTGPWRPYLLTVVRTTAMNWAQTARRAELTDDVEAGRQAPADESGEVFALRGLEDDLVVRCFRSLPARWQAVLWLTLVEEESATDVGGVLGLSPSGVWSLAERAREGLREAYLAEHAHGPNASDQCRRHSALMAAALRRRRPTGRSLNHHLAECPACRRAFRDLKDVNSRLRAVLPGTLMLWGAQRHVSSCATTAATPAAGVGGGGATSATGAAHPVVAAHAVTAAGASLAVASAVGLALYAVAPGSQVPGRSEGPVATRASGEPACAAAADGPMSWRQPPSRVPGPVSCPSPSASTEGSPHPHHRRPAP